MQSTRIQPIEKNVLGGRLEMCCQSPMTGFFRDGKCRTCEEDLGVHTVCAVMTKEFLEFSKAAGNDLSTPRPEFDFPGLKPGNPWCLCAPRWKEAYDNNAAPKVILAATHERSLDYIPLEVLEQYALDVH